MYHMLSPTHVSRYVRLEQNTQWNIYNHCWENISRFYSHVHLQAVDGDLTRD